MRKIFVISLFFFLKNFAFSQVVVNEVHPTPVSGEPEWIELFNVSTKQVIFKNAYLSDLRTTIIIAEIRIPARGFALISRDTSALLETRGIPKNAVLIEAKLPSLNNTTDAVVLKNSDSVTVDSLYYNMKWGFKGISLERRDFRIPAISQSNLSASVSPDSATAGYANSIAILNNDLAVKTLHFDNLLKTLKIVILNVGLNQSSPAELRVFYDKNRDSIFTPDEVFKTFPVGAIPSNDSLVFEVFKNEIELLQLASGATLFSAEISMPGDERAQNDLLKTQVYTAFKSSAILINEIMYEPRDGEAEFVELYNTTSDTLFLKGWTIGEAATFLKIENLKIAPQDYAAVAWDSAFFQQFPLLKDVPNVYVFKSSLALNATGDNILLKDAGGNVIDSLRYSPDWHVESLSETHGISLEKISPLLPSAVKTSWTSSGAQTGATPAAQNSISLSFKSSGDLSAEPNPFSPRGEAQFTIISYELPFEQARAEVSIFDLHGVKVRTVASAIYSGSKSSIAWDGKNDAGFDLPKGAYIVFLEAADIDGTEVFQKKIVVAISK